MTKKDYELLAETIRNNADHFFDVRYMASFVSMLGVELRRDNPRFDIGRFAAACQPRWLVGSSRESDWDRCIAKPVSR